MPLRDQANPALLQGGKEKLDFSCMPQRPDGGCHRLLPESKHTVKFHGKVRDSMFGSSASCWRVSVKDGLRKLQAVKDYNTSKHKVENTTYSPSDLAICDNTAEKTIESASSGSHSENECVRIHNLPSDNFFTVGSGSNQEKRTSNRGERVALQRSSWSYRTECSESFRECQPLPPRKPKSLLPDQRSARNSLHEVSSISESSDSESHAVPLYIAGFEAELMRFHERYDRDMYVDSNYAVAQRQNRTGSSTSVQKVDLNRKANVRRTGFRVKNSKIGGTPRRSKADKGKVLISSKSGSESNQFWWSGSVQRRSHKKNRPMKTGPEEEVPPHITSGCCSCDSGVCSAELGLPNRQLVLTRLFKETVQIMRALIRNFSTSLIEAKEEMMKRLGIELRTTVLALLFCELLPDAQLADSEHLKYGVQAFVSRTVFEEFETESYGVNIDPPDDDCITHSSAAGRDIQTSFAAVSPSEAISEESPVYNRSFHLFCQKKFQLFQMRLDWFEEWPEKLVEAFLDAMKYAWMVHKLAFAFQQPDSVTLFYVNEWAEFDPYYMEAVGVEGAGSSSSSSSASDVATTPKFSSKVQFMIIPGFEIKDKIIKSQVYLNPVTVWCPPKSTTSL